MMALEHWVGTVAAVCTTAAFVPQVWHSWRSRDLSGISLPMYCIFTTGVLLWLLYGMLQHDWPIIVANALTMLLASVVLVLKLISIKNSN